MNLATIPLVHMQKLPLLERELEPNDRLREWEGICLCPTKARSNRRITIRWWVHLFTLSDQGILHQRTVGIHKSAKLDICVRLRLSGFKTYRPRGRCLHEGIRTTRCQIRTGLYE